MEPNQGTLVLKLGEGNGVRAFPNWDELRSWFNEEKNNWGWATKEESGKAAKFINTFTQLRTHVRRVDAPDAGDSTPRESKIQEFISTLEKHYQSNTLVYSESAAGKFILAMSKINTTRACAALDYLTGSMQPQMPNHVQMWERMKGFNEAMLFEKGLDSCIVPRK